MTDKNSPNYTSVLELLAPENDDVGDPHPTVPSTAQHVLGFSAWTEEFVNACSVFHQRYGELGLSIRFETVTLDPVRTRGELLIFKKEISDAGLQFRPANFNDLKVVKDDFRRNTPCKNSNDKALLLAGAELDVEGETIRFSRSEETGAPKKFPAKQQVHEFIVESTEAEIEFQAMLKSLNFHNGTLSFGKLVARTLVRSEDTVYYSNVENVGTPRAIVELLTRVFRKNFRVILVAMHDGSLIEMTLNSTLDILEELANSLLAEISEIRKNSSK